MDLYKINQSKNSLNKVRVSSFNIERELQDLIGQITSLIRTSPESFNGSLLMMYF
ncbi:hypothetical protein IMAU20009_01924 [Lactiplantibacillus plantarum]|nr:hypothetical protein [Lactiplantibacillus plantarum]MCG0673990.1 hypothetical protein [Lactiplantibacillus plantarum]MCG0782489.1 hypothetical protein [Lactiplantibacillus plantarum]MCG0809784.1 hypothetical protein [Lactiplantibacillus plantarum]MCG0862653.1 hypothetical protein [Lactiplantibacillus plantarum]